MTKRPTLRALEKNILKYRALQMILVLHEAEALRSLILGTIRSTDRLRSNSEKVLPPGTKKPMRRALRHLTDLEVLSAEESDEIARCIGFRNDVAHNIHRLVEDISAGHLGRRPLEFDYGAAARLARLHRKTAEAMSGHFILQIDFREIAFEEAAKTYREELVRLRRRIDRQLVARGWTAT